MSSLGPNEPYPEEGRMADLYAFLSRSVARHPDWTARQHGRAAEEHFGAEWVAEVTDHRDEPFGLTVIDMFADIDS